MLDLEGKSSAPTAWLYQSARGGDATATYVIDGQLVQSHRFHPNARVKVSKFDVSLGTNTSVTIVTMPEINSTYPVQLSVDANDAAIADAGSAGSPIYTS